MLRIDYQTKNSKILKIISIQKIKGFLIFMFFQNEKYKTKAKRVHRKAHIMILISASNANKT
jgi:hypothetical protein